MPRSVYAFVVALSLAASACVMVEDDDVQVVDMQAYENQADSPGDDTLAWEGSTQATSGEDVIFLGTTQDGEPIDQASVEIVFLEGAVDLGYSVDGDTIEVFTQSDGTNGGTVSLSVAATPGIGTSP